ncbi:SIMPL domain-containing protein [Candidatus Saccharibacteria bacterium]|nr:SIMPL domain-containing protein [Candidatus Saccharibacteria bacterium]
MANTGNRINLSVDLRVIIGVLLAIIVAMLIMWMPWQNAENDNETITVTGEALVKAEPDQYIFYPSYQFTNVDKTAAINAANAKSQDLTTKLKELGIADNKIKTDINGYKNQPFEGNTNQDYIYSLQLTVTLESRDKAQTIQDYLVTTGPENNVTPQGSFSETKQNELESQARDEATKDARAKADQSANNLGFKLGRVKAVEDGAGFGNPVPLLEGRGIALDSTAQKPESTNVNIMPGENELRYSVTVTYYVR